MIRVYPVFAVGECCAVGVTAATGITTTKSDRAYPYHKRQCTIAIAKLTRACEILKPKITIRLDPIGEWGQSDYFALQRFYMSKWRFILLGTNCFLASDSVKLKSVCNMWIYAHSTITR